MSSPLLADAFVLGAYADDDGVHDLVLERQGAIDIVRPIARDGTVTARSADAPAFAWDEREMADERGIRFRHLPDARPFREHDGRMPDAVTAHGTGLTHVVVGPVHAGIIEPGRFTFSSGGETVIFLDAQVGYAFRGVERALEGNDPRDAATLVARICGSCSSARAHAYALALERLAGIAAARDVALARMVVCEIERVWNHLADLAAGASAAGWGPGFARGMALKERAMRLSATATGHRLGFDAIVPGGVGPTVLRDVDAVRDGLDALVPEVERYLDSLFGNASVMSRWRAAGIVTLEEARAFAAVGPARRATGDPLDVRAFAPYGAYAEFAHRPAVHRGGDVFARYCVKRDEIATSFGLVREALGLLSAERLHLPIAIAPFSPGTAVVVTEGPRGAETIALRIGDDGRIARLHVISASYRNWPVVARAMRENIVPDFPLVNKSFNLCYACADR